MSHTILIYSFVPENMKVFRVPDEILTMTDDDMLTKSHGKMINREEITEAMEYVYAMVSDEGSADLEFESSRKVVGKLLPYLVHSEEEKGERECRVECDVSRIICSGFFY